MTAWDDVLKRLPLDDSGGRADAINRLALAVTLLVDAVREQNATFPGRPTEQADI